MTKYSGFFYVLFCFFTHAVILPSYPDYIVQCVFSSRWRICWAFQQSRLVLLLLLVMTLISWRRSFPPPVSSWRAGSRQGTECVSFSLDNSILTSSSSSHIHPDKGSSQVENHRERANLKGEKKAETYFAKMLACTEMITMCLQSAKHEHLIKQQGMDYNQNQGISLFHDVSRMFLGLTVRFDMRLYSHSAYFLLKILGKIMQ